MKMRSACLSVAALLWLTAASSAQTQAGGPQAVHTNKREFAIPFRSDDAEIQRLGAREVRLFVSVNRGKNWLAVQSVRPDIRRFTVRAPKDGEYWFAVRTVDRNNQLRPQGAMTVELKVIVDTQKPTLDLRLQQPQPGTVRLMWEADDPHLAPQTLVLEARNPGEQNWRRVFVDSQQSAGSTRWQVPQGGLVHVRGRIADRAGNTVTATDDIRISAAKKNVPRPVIPDFSEPIAGRKLDRRGDRHLPEQFPGTSSAGRQPGENHPAPDGEPSRTRTAQKPIVSSAGPQMAVNRATPRGPLIVPRGQGGAQEPPTQTGPSHPPVSQKPFSRFPPVSQRRTKPQPSPKVRLVNRRSFRLNYTLEKVGRSGVNRVELFITPDGGRKWYRYGSDDDHTSPFPVTVPRDGTYGFAIRVQSGVGLSEPPPQPGEKPSVLVTVDQTPPQIELLPVLQGQGKNSNRFLIRWQMGDAHPAGKAIAIAYSESPDGPWHSISEWRSNSGSHLWITPENVPPQVYLRVAARDAAGNVSYVQTPRPIIVDVSKPSARITEIDVEPSER